MIQISNKQCALIDAHCHIFPERIADKAAQATDTFYNFSSPYRATVTGLLSEMEQCGVDLTVVSSVATTAKQVDSIIEFIKEEVNAHPDKLVGLGAYHQERTDPAGDVERMIKCGFKGLKIHPDIQRVEVDDPRLMELYAVCEERHFPVLAHTGDYRYDFSNPNRVKRVLEAFPDLKFIGAHFAGWSMAREASEALKDYENLVVDCSSSFFAMRFEDIKPVIRTFGAERVMFGTDYPMTDAQKEMKIINELGLSDEELEKIYSLNAKRVFGLN